MIKWLTFFARFYSPLKFIAFIKVAGKKKKFSAVHDDLLLY